MNRTVTIENNSMQPSLSWNANSRITHQETSLDAPMISILIASLNSQLEKKDPASH
jgi:hypothetical protein